MHQQLWGYKVEEKTYLGVRERKTLNIAALGKCVSHLGVSALCSCTHDVKSTEL